MIGSGCSLLFKSYSKAEEYAWQLLSLRNCVLYAALADGASLIILNETAFIHIIRPPYPLCHYSRSGTESSKGS